MIKENESKNNGQNRPKPAQRVLEWVALNSDQSERTHFILDEQDTTVTLQVAGSDEIMEGVQKTAAHPIEPYGPTGMYGRYNGYRTVKKEGGKEETLPPIVPQVGYVGGCVRAGHILVTEVKDDGSLVVEDKNGVQFPLAILKYRILPQKVADEAKKTFAKRRNEVMASRPMSEKYWKDMSQGYILHEDKNGRDQIKWPSINIGEISIHRQLGPVFVRSKLPGFNNELHAKVSQLIRQEDGTVEFGPEQTVHIIARVPNKNQDGTHLESRFYHIDQGFLARLTKEPNVAEMLKKSQKPSLTTSKE